MELIQTTTTVATTITTTTTIKSLRCVTSNVHTPTNGHYVHQLGRVSGSS